MGRWPKDIQPFGVIGSVDAVDRLMEATHRRSRHVYGDSVTPPSVAQVGMVLRGLADHTSNMQAVTWAPEPGGYWPEATSVGRWMHAYANACEYRAQGWTEDPPQFAPSAMSDYDRARLDVLGDVLALIEAEAQTPSVSALADKVRALKDEATPAES